MNFFARLWNSVTACFRGEANASASTQNAAAAGVGGQASAPTGNRANIGEVAVAKSAAAGVGGRQASAAANTESGPKSTELLDIIMDEKNPENKRVILLRNETFKRNYKSLERLRRDPLTKEADIESIAGSCLSIARSVVDMPKVNAIFRASLRANLTAASTAASSGFSSSNRGVAIDKQDLVGRVRGVIGDAGSFAPQIARAEPGLKQAFVAADSALKKAEKGSEVMGAKIDSSIGVHATEVSDLIGFVGARVTADLDKSMPVPPTARPGGNNRR
jgi:hypothetical protein